MKKYFVYFITVLALSIALCGCGRDKVNDNSIVISPTVSPATTIEPSESIMPELEDGAVNDEDGIIEDKDNGNATKPAESTVPAPSATVKP